MVDTIRKLIDIAEIIGISEDECRWIANDYETLLQSKKIGKIQVYDENMVDRFRKIADLRAQGLPKEVIMEAIKCSKTLEDRALEDMKRVGIETPEKQPIHALKPISLTETEEKLILAVRSVGETVQTMDHRMAAMRERIADDNMAVRSAITEIAKEVATVRGEVHTLWDQIASLEQYFRDQNAEKKLKFWKW
jgi:DNA-binding transcriptional MerR regulator